MKKLIFLSYFDVQASKWLQNDQCFIDSITSLDEVFYIILIIYLSRCLSEGSQLVTGVN